MENSLPGREGQVDNSHRQLRAGTDTFRVFGKSAPFALAIINFQLTDFSESLTSLPLSFTLSQHSPSQQSTVASRPCSCSPGVAARGFPSLSPSPTSNPPTSRSPSQYYRCPSHSPSFHWRSSAQQSTAGSHPCPHSPGVVARAHPCPPFLLPLPPPKPVLPMISVSPKFPLLLTLFLVLVLLLIPN